MVFRGRGRYKLDESKNEVRQTYFDKLQDPDFEQKNFRANIEMVEVFRQNTKYILIADNVPINTFFKELGKTKCKIKNNAFFNSTRTNPPSSLLLTTFARVLGVSISALLDPDLPTYYNK